MLFPYMFQSPLEEEWGSRLHRYDICSVLHERLFPDDCCGLFIPCVPHIHSLLQLHLQPASRLRCCCSLLHQHHQVKDNSYWMSDWSLSGAVLASDVKIVLFELICCVSWVFVCRPLSSLSCLWWRASITTYLYIWIDVRIMWKCTTVLFYCYHVYMVV